MNRRVARYCVLVIILLFTSYVGFSQAPNITYSSSSYSFPVGTAITTLTPTNSGGAVPANVYSTVTTFAGSTSGRTNGTGTGAKFKLPAGIFVNSTGTMFIADFSNNEIRKITSAAVVTLFAGSTAGTAGRANGTTTAATFNGPNDITGDAAGNLYVADQTNNEIRQITSAGVVTLLAGSATATAGKANGTGTGATFSSPAGVAYDAVSGSVYVADQTNNEIRKVTTAGVVTLFAGSTAGTAGLANATGTSATFKTPSKL